MKDKIPVKLTARAVIYPILWAFSLVFTQLLRNRVSNAFFWFVCIFPLISVIYTLIGKISVHTYVESGRTDGNAERCEKNTPVNYKITIVNSSPLPIGKTEATVSEPQSDGVKCVRRKITATVVSFGVCVIENTVKFPYRGGYDIGIEDVWVYSPLGSFALKCSDGKNLNRVTVFPRKMALEREYSRDMTDDAAPSAERTVSSEITEPSDIKDYTPGDPIKSIHWKLSSKSQEIKVRKYDSVERKLTYILCDLSSGVKLPERSPTELYDSMKELLSDSGRKDTRKIRTLKNRVAALAEDAEGDIKSKKANPFSGIFGYFRMKKVEDNYKKNVKKGMTKEQAETVKTVDLLIASSTKTSLSSSKKSNAKVQRAKSAGEKAEISLQKEEERLKRQNSEEHEAIEKILQSVKEKENVLDAEEKLYGGRVKSEFVSDYDELCADRAVELSIAVAYSEILSGNTVVAAWFDPREDSGIALYSASTVDEIETVYNRLSSAPVVPTEYRVSGLTAAIGGEQNAKIKIVTSNIDPVSLGEIELIPSKLGNTSSGTVAEALLISPFDKYENPSARAAFAADVENRLRSKGFVCNIWAESTGEGTQPVFSVV